MMTFSRAVSSVDDGCATNFSIIFARYRFWTTRPGGSQDLRSCATTRSHSSGGAYLSKLLIVFARSPGDTTVFSRYAAKRSRPSRKQGSSTTLAMNIRRSSPPPEQAERGRTFMREPFGGAALLMLHDMSDLQGSSAGKKRLELVVPEARHADDVAREYANDKIMVRWEPGLCIHVGECSRRLAEVFRPGERPWVRVDEADPDEIAATVRACPAGALHYERLDGGPAEEVSEETTVAVQKGGPLYVQGQIRVTDHRGNVLREDTRVALCRCGQSKNKTFCDGTHNTIMFK